MALTISTPDPAKLLADIKSAIKEGKVKTWSVDGDGDFTHSAEQWRYRAWFKPTLGISELRLYILAPKATAISKVVYAVYHGRFIEAILSHFDTDVTSLRASSLPEGNDIVASS